MALNSPKHLLNVQDERLNYVKKDPHIIQEGLEHLDTRPIRYKAREVKANTIE